ncbi:WxL domain-containing protein [Levilactobacillus fujinensis]|uniref:WxL domain-containing protein n=1 Tax=Levilactobacillus fujinensis TaxID=2486024 RepID=A0ABW1TJ68_9LACO|nr:WxL domain-containing protein [Levilactobacillus fujinensis]
MTKKTLQLLATAALVAGFGFTTVTANAATTSTGKDTTATATLNTPKPDTTDPGDAGGIKLVTVPNIDFGTATLDASSDLTLDTSKVPAGTDKDGNATGVQGSIDNPVQVKNAGFSTGWIVQVSTADAMKDAGKTHQLTGAQMVLNPGALTSTNVGADGTTVDSTTGAPTTQVVKLNGGAANGVQTVMSAAAGDGMGTWNEAFTNATISIPSQTVAGVYTANLNWQLTNAPTNTVA